MSLDALNASMLVTLNWSARVNNSGTNPTQQSGPVTKQFTFTLGNASGQINELVHTVRVLANAASEELDIAANLTNVCQQTTVPIDAVKVFAIEHLANSASSSIQVGNSSSNPWKVFMTSNTTTFDMPNNSFLVFGVSSNTGALAVTNGSADKLKVLNSDAVNSATYRLVLYAVDIV